VIDPKVQGSTGRWPVGFGGPPKPPHQRRPSIKPLNTLTTRKISRLLISAVCRRCVAACGRAQTRRPDGP